MYTVTSLLFSLAIIVLPVRDASGQVLTRDAAIAMALEFNPRVAAAQAAWQTAKARTLVSLALENPELEIKYEELPGVFGMGQFGERNIGITQRIESPLKWWFRQRAFSQEAESVRYATFEATRLSVAVGAKTTFDRVLMDQHILAAVQENLSLARDFAQKASTRFQAGDVAQLEVMRAEVEMGLAENELADAEARLAASRATLNGALGREISTLVEISGDLTIEPKPLDLNVLIDRAAMQRPDLKGALQMLGSIRSAKSGAVASLVPDLNLGVSRQTIVGPNSRSSFWRTTFGIEIPVWAPFRQRGEVSAASAEARRAEAEYESLKQRAMVEVGVSYFALSAASKRAAVFESRVLKLAEAAFEAASKSYREGKATYLEFLDTQKTLVETRIAYYESIFEYRQALAELERATGGSL